LKPSCVFLIAGSLSLAVAGAFAQTQTGGQTLVANPLYEKNCAKCHGKTAEGRHFGGPALISEKTAAESPDELRNVITNGKGHMPKFVGKLTAEDIDQLVQQISAANKK
jgi:mono/diheme cytochrome c family protein